MFQLCFTGFSVDFIYKLWCNPWCSKTSSKPHVFNFKVLFCQFFVHYVSIQIILQFLNFNNYSTHLILLNIIKLLANISKNDYTLWFVGNRHVDLKYILFNSFLMDFTHFAHFQWVNQLQNILFHQPEVLKILF